MRGSRWALISPSASLAHTEGQKWWYHRPTTSSQYLMASVWGDRYTRTRPMERSRWEERRLWRVQGGLAWPPRMSIQGNILYPMINLNHGNSYKKWIAQDMCIYKDLPYKERPSLPRNKCQLYITIKAPKLSHTKVHIIYPSPGTLKLWKFINLTFERYLANTIPVLFARSSLFLFRRFCLEHERTMWLTNDFWHHQLASFVGMKIVIAILPLPRQRVVWHSLARW